MTCSDIGFSLNKSQVFQTKYARPVKEFNNVAFANGVIMNGSEARDEYEKKLAAVQAKKDQVETNKRKREEKKATDAANKLAYEEAKKTNSKLTLAAFKRSRMSETQNNENVEPTQSISSAQQSGFKCSDCNIYMIHQTFENQKQWHTCCDCDKWFCGACMLNKIFSTPVLNEEFCCDDCSCKV
jgi:hypothetical protein